VTRAATAVSIRSYSDGDETGVLHLLNAALGVGPAGERSAGFFRWKHLNNPFGRSFMLVAEADDRIVGLRAFMRWEFVSAGRRFRGHGDASRIPGARDLLKAHARSAGGAENGYRLRVQHAEREESARIPEDGVAAGRTDADLSSGASARPFRPACSQLEEPNPVRVSTH
jgi:hypothetical protein